MTKKITDVGIDLGTSNCAVAYLTEDKDLVHQLPIKQLESPGHIFEHATLPSAIYLASEHEIGSEDLLFANDTKKGELSPVVGTWAFQQGSLNPDRFIHSAKSWLCYGRVHRQEPILPWGATDDIPKMSPVQASALFLKHLQYVLSQESEDPQWTQNSQIVVTVPASFDEIARQLTQEAMKEADLPDHTLLEEPLAAFYSWIASTGDQWRDQVEDGDVVLVCDVGGGTSDFSLIVVKDEDGLLQLERIAVGKHLLLGGDNMDLALAYTIKQQMDAEGESLDPWQLMSLTLNARMAKEKLLSEDDLDELPISFASRSSSLFESTRSTKIDRTLIDQVILNGFFPYCKADEEIQSEPGFGIQEFGLPYVHDPAITRHLAQFLRQARVNIESDSRLSAFITEGARQHPGMILPNKILFNGGVFKSKTLRDRILATIEQWGVESIKELEGADYELSVSRGAAYYARMKRTQKGIRIRSGTARSYYLGIASGMMAIPGYRPPVKGLCIVPQGTEEGTDLSLPKREFALITGRPAHFQLYSSRTRAGDHVGSEISDADKELEQAAKLTITLPTNEEEEEGRRVPVTLDASVDETGTMSLYMKHLESDQKWKLEFDLRSYE